MPPIGIQPRSSMMTYPLLGSASAATSGTSRRYCVGVVHMGLVTESGFMTPGTPDSAWYDGMHHDSDTPPPPAPSVSLESFQTLSEEVASDVPPTETTSGWLPGSSTDGVVPWLVPGSP